jgi:hypothetical protein
MPAGDGPMALIVTARRVVPSRQTLTAAPVVVAFSIALPMTSGSWSSW